MELKSHCFGFFFFPNKHFLLISERKTFHVLQCCFFQVLDFCFYFVFIFPNVLLAEVASLAPRESAEDPQHCRAEVCGGDLRLWGCEETWASCCQQEQGGKGFPEVHCLTEIKDEAHGKKQKWEERGAGRIPEMGSRQRSARDHGWCHTDTKCGNQLAHASAWRGVAEDWHLLHAHLPCAFAGHSEWEATAAGPALCRRSRRWPGLSGACWGPRAGIATFPRGIAGC